VLRVDAGAEAADDFHRRGIDHRDVAIDPIGHIDAVERGGGRGAETAGSRLAIEILRVDHRRHSGYRHNLPRLMIGGVGFIGVSEPERSTREPLARGQDRGEAEGGQPSRLKQELHVRPSLASQLPVAQVASAAARNNEFRVTD
jgi:hypothetical protein